MLVTEVLKEKVMPGTEVIALRVMVLEYDIEDRGWFTNRGKAEWISNLNVENCNFTTKSPSAIISQNNQIENVQISNSTFSFKSVIMHN